MLHVRTLYTHVQGQNALCSTVFISTVDMLIVNASTLVEQCELPSGYGSIPIDTFLLWVIHIHFNPAMTWGSRMVPGFWPIPISLTTNVGSYGINWLVPDPSKVSNVTKSVGRFFQTRGSRCWSFRWRTSLKKRSTQLILANSRQAYSYHINQS